MSDVPTKKDVPIDLNIPDNYVQHTLTTTKPLPPISLSNILNEINWLSFIILTSTPIMGVIGAYYTKLRWETAIWAVVYYFITGLGITAGVPPSLGAQVVQCLGSASIYARYGRSRLPGGLDQVVVSRSPRTSPVHRHRSRSIQRSPGLFLLARRLDARQA